MALFQELGAPGDHRSSLVTHEPDIAAFASRVVVVKDGRVVSDERQDAEGRRRSRSGSRA